MEMNCTRQNRVGVARASLASMLIAIASAGCAQYRTPGDAANFRAMGITLETQDELTQPSIARRLAVKPAADFPTRLAIARVQDRGYHSYSTRGYGSGDFTIITERDIEPDDTFDRIADLPMVQGVAAMNRLILPENFHNEQDLRWAAAQLHADILLLYTLDTDFDVEHKLAPLAVFTLGLFPQEEARVSSTASAILLDTRTGYVYGLAESTSHTTQLANSWTSTSAIDQSRRRAERRAFADLLAEVEDLWARVAQEYGPPATGSDTSDDAMEKG